MADDQDDCEPVRKKRRFKSPTKDYEIAVLSKGVVPKNTEKNTQWAVRVFEEWR